MTPEAWQKVSTLLDQALDLGPAEQAQFLDRLRDQDPSLCEEIRSLLEQQPSTLLETPPLSLSRALPETSPEPAIPKQLGPYRIIRLLGAGGMGVVYEAEDPVLQRSVALKVMKPEHGLVPNAKERFLREARAAAALHHDNVMPIYHVGEENGVQFLVMPLLRGETLEDRLRRTRLPIDQTLRLGREIAAGLAAAHSRGLIHRDIKPANIWIEEGHDRVRIMDFGLARPTGAESAALTQLGQILGTPCYMAPEQGRGDEVDARTDLFSLGCILYRLLTGALPFQRKDAVASIVAAATEIPKPPAQINPSVPAAYSEFVLKLLAKAPGDRPSSALDVVDCIVELEHAFKREQTGTSTPTALDGTAKRSFRLWRVAIFAAMALLVAISAGAYLLNTSTVPTDPPLVQLPVVPTQPNAKATLSPATQAWLAKKDSQQILTVARDGSGMYRTLGEAIDALKPGQVVQVLDKGPYREDLKKSLPQDTGIVSAVGTRVELPRWHKHFAVPAGIFYHGASLITASGAHLAGLEFIGPELESDSFYTALLMLEVRGEVVVEACRFLHRPAYPLQLPPADFFANSFFTALHVDGTPQKESSCTVRNSLLYGSLVLSRFAVAPQATLIEQNFIIGWRRLGIGLDSRTPGKVTVRHNVVLGDSPGVGVSPFWQNCGFPIQITNNYFEQTGPGLSFDGFNVEAIKQQGELALPAQVRFENNIIRSAMARSIGLAVEGHDIARQKWKIGHNCYRTNPAAAFDLPRHASDSVRPEPFLSDDPKDRSCYLRIAADNPLATQGAGGDLPNYIGPFPPGLAPKDGDWFTSILDWKYETELKETEASLAGEWTIAPSKKNTFGPDFTHSKSFRLEKSATNTLMIPGGSSRAKIVFVNDELHFFNNEGDIGATAKFEVKPKTGRIQSIEWSDGSVFTRVSPARANSGPQPRPNGLLLFEDRFDTAQPLTGPIGTPKITFENQNGRGKLVTTLHGLTAVDYKKNRFKDFAAEYEFEAINPGPNSSFGLAFRNVHVPGHVPIFYTLLFDATTSRITFACFHKERNFWKPFTIKEGSLRNRMPNKVRIEAVGDDFRVFFNGSFIGQITDTMIGEAGFLSFIVFAHKEEESTVYFSNLRVYSLGER